VTPTRASGPAIYPGRAWACVSVDPGRYALVTPNGRTIAELHWHPRPQVWVFVPAPGTSWTSGTLADVATEGEGPRNIEGLLGLNPSYIERIFSRKWWLPGGRTWQGLRAMGEDCRLISPLRCVGDGCVHVRQGFNRNRVFVPYVKK
jgi:hypothetical protein